MSASLRPALRWFARISLWTLVGAVVWLTVVQVFLVALNPFCQLQKPRIAHVTVRSVDPNPDSHVTDFATVKEGDQERVLVLPKAEAATLHPDDEVWILDAWYSDNLRPTQFRLTLLRLLLEYPLLLILPAALGFWRVHRAQVRADAAPPPPVRRVFTDDFHLRAQRFAQPDGEPQEPQPPKKD
jgi:hypothetical protein